MSKDSFPGPTSPGNKDVNYDLSYDHLKGCVILPGERLNLEILLGLRLLKFILEVRISIFQLLAIELLRMYLVGAHGSIKNKFRTKALFIPLKKTVYNEKNTAYYNKDTTR